MSAGHPEYENTEQLVARLVSDLPNLARQVIKNTPVNENLISNPDSVEEHAPGWHQFGIITHSTEFLRMYREEEAGYLEDWEMSQLVAMAMATEIDGRSKAELMEIAILLHDIGKFAGEIVDNEGENLPSRNHDGHASKSKELILGPLKAKLSLEYGLTDAQLEYIATCADFHYELGNLRSQIIEMDEGYNIETTKSEMFGELVGRMIDGYPENDIEIGLLFLGDSLSKTDIVIDAQTDSDIEAQTTEIEETLRNRALNPKLIRAVKQRPVNIAVAKRYFEELKKSLS